ncbi:LacI family DNA-binding transcriptional regulator [Candidatus Haliotispira prima]|uniref:LacI family DNA-binding transcriptional regulator n=1 Tax=Candidatus Haliotispira prima TaxID=3034016 RepID=A0ABY8MFK8_9SPIO|nr:LacI family DNA-binding transcriptional regulator [Candidatus Haliotispira prima]
MAKKTTRVSDIAKMARVSPATVSLVLNNRKGISSAVAKRVQQIAFEMGYHKGLSPKLKMRNVVAQVCILQIRKEGDFIETQLAGFESFTSGIVDYTIGLQGEREIHLEVRNTNWDLADIQAALSSAFGRDLPDRSIVGSTETKEEPAPDSGAGTGNPADDPAAQDKPPETDPKNPSVPPKNVLKRGLLVIATELNAQDIFRLARNIDLPSVFIDAPYPELPYDFVNINNTHVMYDIVWHLKEQGYRNPAYVHALQSQAGQSPASQSPANCSSRSAALRKAMRHYGMGGEPRLIGASLRGDNEGLLVRQQLEQLHRDAGREFPDAFVCYSDIQAYSIIKTLQEMGFRIPEDIAVVGFENMISSPFFSPPLSSVAIPRREIGVRAIKRLLEKLTLGEKKQEGSHFPVSQEINCRFVARESSSRG